jgi:predicted GIY-YIG superfamily endonuclease
MKISYIYALYYKGKPFYIGQTLTPKKRFSDHRCKSFSGSHRDVQNLLEVLQR